MISKTKPDKKKVQPADDCEDGLEHDITECPQCNYNFCSSCGLGEDD